MSGLVIADRVKETTATTGTGTINLAGAVTQFQSFINGVGTGNVCEYTLLGGNGTDWEVGLGTVTSGSPNTLSRSTILSSSNSGSAISLTGTSTVFLTKSAKSFTKSLCAPIVPPSAATNWTQRNFGSNTTLTDVANGVCLFDSSTASVSQNLRGATLSSPSTPYTIDANFSTIYIGPSGAYFMFGLGWTDGTKIEFVATYFNANAATFGYLQVAVESNYTTDGTSPAGNYGLFNTTDFWIRIADSGTNVTFSASHDGVSWLQLYTVAKSSGYLGSSGYSNVGIFLSGGYMGNGGSGSVTLRSWWQH